MVVAYGRIIKPHVLAHLSMVNVHFSLLPRWRGAAPVERALLAGDDVTGVCIMDVEEGLDTGGVHARREVPIGPTTTADELRRDLVAIGTELLVDVLSRPLGPAEPQVGDVTYAAKITPDELQLDWSRPAAELDRVVRVGGAWTTFRGRRLKVLAATPTDGAGGDAGRAGRRRGHRRHGRRRPPPRHRAARGEGRDGLDRVRQRRPSGGRENDSGPRGRRFPRCGGAGARRHQAAGSSGRPT